MMTSDSIPASSFRSFLFILSGYVGSHVGAETPKFLPDSTVPVSADSGHIIVKSIKYLLPRSLPRPQPREEIPAVVPPSGILKNNRGYPWKNDIVTTVFWVGEKPTTRNPTPNTASSWDPKWSINFGGYDNPDPSARIGWLPKDFVPSENPFYIALPYNDTSKLKTKKSARQCVPWFNRDFYRDGKSVLKGRWLAIRRGGTICYAQWEDCGPFETDNWQYVFGNRRPNTSENNGAGLDVSPAVRDYLGFRSNARCDWRFVEAYEVPDGPWKRWGNNNPFALRDIAGD